MSRLPVFPPGLQRSTDASSASALSGQDRGYASASSPSSATSDSASSFNDVLAGIELVAGPVPAPTPLLAQATTFTLQSRSAGAPGNLPTAGLPQFGDGTTPLLGTGLEELLPEAIPVSAIADQSAGIPAALGLLPASEVPLASDALGIEAPATGVPGNAALPGATVAPLQDSIAESAGISQGSQSGTPADNAIELPGDSGRTAEQVLRSLRSIAGQTGNATTPADAATVSSPAAVTPASTGLPQADGLVRVVSVRSERLPQPETASPIVTTPATGAPLAGLPVNVVAQPAGISEVNSLHVAGLADGAGLDASTSDISEAGSRSQGTETPRIESLQGIEPRTDSATVSKLEAATVSQQIARTVVQRIQWETVDTKTHMTLELQPATLGTVQVVLELERKELSIQIITQSESIRAVVEAQLNDLTTLLRQAGIDFSGCDVTCQEGEPDKWDDARERRSGPGTGQPVPDEAGETQADGRSVRVDVDGAVDLVA